MKTIVALILIACSIALITVQQVQAEGEGKGGGDAKSEAKGKGGGDAKPEAKGKGGGDAKADEEKKRIDTINETDQRLNAEFDLPFYFRLILTEVYNNFNLNGFEDGIKSIHEQVQGYDRIAAYVAVYGIASSMSKLDDPRTVSLAFLLKEQMKGFKKKSSGLKLANQLKDKLPKSIKNVAFADCVLIRRKAKSEDMYAAGDGLKKDPKRRRVFTWIPGEPQNNDQGCWAVEPIKSEGSPIASAYYIKNRQSEEYFYADQDHLKDDDKRRLVFTWVPGGSQKSAWIFEPSGEDTYIKAATFGEYLSTDDKKKFNDKSRVVYTTKEKSPDGLWAIESGDDAQMLPKQ